MTFIYSKQTGITNLEQLSTVMPAGVVETFVALNGHDKLINTINQIDHDYYGRSMGTCFLTIREATAMVKQSHCTVLEDKGGVWVTSTLTVDDFMTRPSNIDLSNYKLVAKSNQFVFTWADYGLLCHVGAGIGKFRKNLRMHLSTVCGITIGIHEHALIDHYTTYLNKRGTTHVQKT